MNINQPEKTNYSTPTLNADGMWLSLGGAAVSASLSEGAAREALSLLASMDDVSAKLAITENGFDVPSHHSDLAGVLSSLYEPFQAIANARGDVSRTGLTNATAVDSFAAKAVPQQVHPYQDFADAKSVIAAVMRAPSVAIELTGSAQAHSRASLLMLAGEAISKETQGFSFDGLAGKFEIPLNLAQVGELYRDAAGAVAAQSARLALGQWSSGAKVAELHEWVPDSVQRLLHGAVSLPAASAIVHAIESGAIARHANEIGTQAFANLMASQGVDVHAQTIEQQAAELEVGVVEPERNRGTYVGKVIGMDYRAALIKFNRNSAIELPLSAIPGENRCPVMGDTVRVGFKGGVMSLSIADRVNRELSDR